MVYKSLLSHIHTFTQNIMISIGIQSAEKKKPAFSIITTKYIIKTNKINFSVSLILHCEKIVCCRKKNTNKHAKKSFSF